MPNKNTCMGIFQFDADRKRIFDEIVKPLVNTHTGLVYEDARDYYEPSFIKMDLISKMIEESNLVIADLSEKNPNVFLELGIAYNLQKPLILLCSKEAFEDKDKWGKNLPFDLHGCDLLIFNNENDLKVKLGTFIFDSLYLTKTVSRSWISMVEDNHIKSATEMEVFNKGEIWSDAGLNSNFILSFHVKIHNVLEKHEKEHKNPDVRLFLSTTIGGYPQITIIFPWELSEIDNTKYECHIDYSPSTTQPGIRLQQVSVANRDIDKIKEFAVFLSFCWPNLVFESSFFEDKINRLMYPINGFRIKGYPVHLSQFVGFESINSRVSISNIKIKEVFV